MENVLISALCIGLILFGMLTFSEGSISATDKVAAAWSQREATSEEIARTRLESVSMDYDGSGHFVTATLANVGETHLRDFENWDVILQYSAKISDELQVRRLAYTEASLDFNQWEVEGIYLDAASSQAEVFEAGILNPNEEIVIQMKIDPLVNPNNDASMAIITTSNGVTCSTVFHAN